MDKALQHQRFNEILATHKGIIFKVARSYCHDETDRQDLIQEILIQIWQSLHTYNTKYAITTWLYRVSLNTAISHYRKSKTRGKYFIALEPGFDISTFLDNTEKEQNLNLLEQFISELKEIDKALMLLYLEDKNHAEISEILGLSISNISTKIARIKEKLKSRFSLNKI
ncbi:MAG TPA: RNA polymerase sigma factor [Ferruginibacter sp.]|nr:RNA polymerase sigma factor [Ferruginibacter sp.]